MGLISRVSSRTYRIMRIFITVGTTKFESLMKTLGEIRWQDIFKNEVIELKIQYGCGQKPNIQPNENLTITCYDYKPTLEPDILEADLIISHAGAGTTLEVLEKQKKSDHSRE